jgi:hypothetical protein
MKLEAMRDEAKLAHAERSDWANNLEDAIRRGHVRPAETEASAAKLSLLRSSLPGRHAVWRALTLIVEWRDRLPKDLIDLMEAEL